MKAQDWMNQDNNRMDAVNDLIRLATALGLDYEYTEKEFVIKLPYQEPVNVFYQPARDRGIDWGRVFGSNSGVHEDELPPVDKPLEEGETPDETK